jgi:hypothetical protein
MMDLSVNAKQIERLTKAIGVERCAERDAAATAYTSQPLAKRKAAPPGVTAPKVAVVGVDGGRLQIRDSKPQGTTKAPDTADETSAASGPVEGPESLPPDERQRGTHWREDKIGVLMTMASEPSASDPCPELPTVFRDPTRITKLVRELKTKRSAAEVSNQQEAARPSEHPEEVEAVLQTAGDPVRWTPPEVQTRHLAATRRPWSAFGPMMAARAWALGFFQAERRVFLGDGSDNNWTMWRERFSSFTPVLDIIHAISYVFAAAMAGRPFRAGWPVYVQWVTWVWQGRVVEVIAALAQRQLELGETRDGEGETHPRVLVATALGYLQNHQDKMKYAEYRCQGLPITSSYVESAVKQFNYRVKGTEKFWTEDGAEAMLQLRADDLSDGRILSEFWQRRQARATGQTTCTIAA